MRGTARMGFLVVAKQIRESNVFSYYSVLLHQNNPKVDVLLLDCFISHIHTYIVYCCRASQVWTDIIIFVFMSMFYQSL